MGILVIAAGGVLSSMLYSQKLAQSNLSQSYAELTAQSIIEQVVRLPADILGDNSAPGVPVLIPFVTTGNNTVLERVTIPWATDEDDFVDFGSATNPSRGILVDAAYIPDGHVIRPERYMRMRVNLSRINEPAEHRITIVLRFQWEVPDRKNADGTPVFLGSQLTTVRSTAVSF